MQTLPFGPYQIINRGKWISTSKLDSTKSYLHNHTKRALHFHASLFIFQYIYVYVCDSSMLHVSIVVGYPRPKREKKQGGTFNYILQNNNWIVGEKVFFLGVIIWNIYIYIYIFWRYGTGPFQILHLALVLVWESWLGISNPILPLTQKPFTSRHSISSPTRWILSWVQW